MDLKISYINVSYLAIVANFKLIAQTYFWSY